ncbi:MAG: DUF488 domain-containing protein, partial [Chloroflexi bacterium]|nr:DUF488 domain-containing protein [Chloroflexota bacterium]
MPDHPLILTIGYSSRGVTDFLELLKKYEIAFLIDIRSTPYSQLEPDFDKDRLAVTLSRQGIRYVFMGDALGAQPENPECYVNGEVSFERLREQEGFRQGMGRVQKAFEQGLRVALMDTPAQPEASHRSYLIGQMLGERGIPVQHIDENGG